MKYRLLGKTGLKVSEIGFGCWGIGKGMWKADDEESRKALRKAVEQGINFFDTAWVYGDGHSEKLVGELASKSDIIIATKVPPKNRQWPAELDVDIEDVFPKEHIIRFARESRKNLGRKIDLLQLHVWTDKWTEGAESRVWMEAFEQLKQEGVADFFGVSVNDHAPETALKIAESGKVDSLQVIYNIFDQSPEDELFKIARKNNLGIIARVPFDEGALTGKLTYETRFEDWRKHYFGGERLKEAVDRAGKLGWLEKPERTIAQAALQFCISSDAVSTVIPGMTKERHVIDNAAASEGRLTAEELKRLRSHRWQKNFYDAL